MRILLQTTLLVVTTFLSLEIHAQQVLDIDVTEMCKEEESIQNELKNSAHCESCTKDKNSVLSDLDHQLKDFTPLVLSSAAAGEASKKAACKSIMEVAALNPDPQELKIQDQEGNPWKIRFHFGHSRMFGSIRPSDVHVKSDELNGTIKGFTFKERTSDKYFNPAKWNEVGDASKWIDEPSNTITISIENKKNAIYLTAYHPKLLKTYYEKKETIDGIEHTSYVNGTHNISSGTPEAIAAIPEGTRGIEIQNTHKLMAFQIGYGRKFQVFDTKKAGKLTYIVRADVGVQTGAARTIIIDKTDSGNHSWVEHFDKWGVQGYNADVGHRVEYQRGRFGLFVDQKMVFSKIEHGFMEGTASYNMQYTPTTFGVSIDLVTFGKKKAAKLKQDADRAYESLEKNKKARALQ